MKQTRKTRQAAARKKQAEQAPKQVDRRKALMWGGGTIAAVAGGGYFIAGSFAAHAAEHDLTRIGQGKPTVVQIHDPTCPMCTALQREARQALKGFGECDIVYLVADIKTEAGAAFAARHGAPHVTLMLFDATGRHVETLNGPRQDDELKPVFERLHRTST